MYRSGDVNEQWRALGLCGLVCSLALRDFSLSAPCMETVQEVGASRLG